MGQRVQHSANFTSTNSDTKAVSAVTATMKGCLVSMSFAMLVSTEVTVIYCITFLMKIETVFVSLFAFILEHCEDLITVLAYLCWVIILRQVNLCVRLLHLQKFWLFTFSYLLALGRNILKCWIFNLNLSRNIWVYVPRLSARDTFRATNVWRLICIFIFGCHIYPGWNSQ